MDSDDDDQCTLQFLLQKKESKPKELDDFGSVNIRDIVMMERESFSPRIPVYEAKECIDEPPAAWEAKSLFHNLMMGLELKELPQWT